MKKYIGFIFFFIIWTSGIIGLVKIYAVDIYTLGGLSYDYAVGSIYQDPEKEWFQGNIASGISQSFSCVDIFIEAELETEMYKAGGTNFCPTHQDYYVRGGVWIGPVSVQYEHLCKHNVDTMDITRNGGHDRVSVMFDSRRGK